MLPTSSVSAADDFILQLAVDRGLVSAEQLDGARGIVAGHSDVSTPAPRVLDVLVRQGHPKEALAKYDEALKYAPNWAALKEARAAVAKQKT